MTGSLAPTIPTIGQPNSTEDVDVKTSLETLRDGLNAVLNSDNTVMGMQTYRNIFQATTFAKTDLVAGTYPLINGNPKTSGSNFDAANVPILYFDDADYLITGKTLKLRTRAQVACNATKATMKFTFGLYPITVAGGIDEITMTLGAVIGSSTVEINEPAASTVSQGASAEFNAPTDGAYVLGVVTSATLTNNSDTLLSAQLQVKNV